MAGFHRCHRLDALGPPPVNAGVSPRLHPSMKRNEQSPAFRVEYGIVAATILGLCGQFHIVFLSCIAWFLLRQVRPRVSPLVVLVASTFVASLILSFIDIASGHMSIPVTVEILVLNAVALLLFFTGA